MVAEVNVLILWLFANCIFFLTINVVLVIHHFVFKNLDQIVVRKEMASKLDIGLNYFCLYTLPIGYLLSLYMVKEFRLFEGEKW